MFDFGKRLQQLRLSHNMSQETLGKKINRSKSVICTYENNLRIPPLEVLTDMAFFSMFPSITLWGSIKPK